MWAVPPRRAHPSHTAVHLHVGVDIGFSELGLAGQIVIAAACWYSGYVHFSEILVD
jgi:hypothetical protein